MSPNQLRIDQYETVLYDANLNPLGIPKSVKQSIANNIGSIINLRICSVSSLPFLPRRKP